MKRIVFVFVLFTLIAACVASPPLAIPTEIETASNTFTSQPPATNTPQPTATSVPVLTLRVMTFNILFGGGVDRKWDQNMEGQTYFQGKNRLDLILKTIKDANPDILGIEEAASWEKGSPSVIQQVSEQIGLPYYYLAPAQSGLNTAILSKYEIVDKENLAKIAKSRILRASVKIPDGQLLQVFVVHLNSHDWIVRRCELQTLSQIMQSYHTQRLIIMGDMNESHDTVYEFLNPLGMEAVQGLSIDQIWMNKLGSEEWLQTQISHTIIGASDHDPQGAEITIFFRPASALITPSPLAPMLPETSWCDQIQ